MKNIKMFLSKKRKNSYLRFSLFITTLGLICFLYRNNLKPVEIETPYENHINHVDYLSRQLLSVNEINNDNDSDSNKIKKNECIRPDIEQFPKTLFNQNQRIHGAVVIHFLIAIYMFIGLAIVCDEYFVPSLNDICKFFKLKEDVAGNII